MRKKTIKFGLDNIFWYILYSFPILLTFVQSINIFSNFTAEQWNVSLVQTNYGKLLYENLVVLGGRNSGFIIDMLVQIIGKNGVLPLQDNTTMFMFMQYFISIYICHLLVDFILFIPRLCHKWMNAFTKTED